MQQPDLPAAPRSAGRMVLAPLAVFLSSRLLVFLLVGATVVLGGQLPSHHYSGPWPTPPAGPIVLQALGSWDASWYLTIAAHGYVSASAHTVATQAQVAFFPVWPGLIRAVSDVTGLRPLDTSVGLAVVTGFLACAAVWVVTKELCGRVVADRATTVWAFFPGSLVLTMGYAEGLTIFCSALSLFGLLRRRWLLAGVLAGVATGTQPEALVLIVCCAWAAGVAVARGRDWLALAAPLLSLGGVAAYFGYLWARTGDALRWYHVEKTDWGSGAGFGHVTVGALRQTFTDPHVIDSAALSLGLLVAVAGLVAMVRWRPPVVVWIYTVGILGLALASDQVGARSRVLLVAFPLLVALARAAGARWSGPLTGAFATLLGAMTLIVLSAVLISP